MGQILTEIAQSLKDATFAINARPESTVDVKVQLIYAFNGTGKTRLSREFKKLITLVELQSEEVDTVESTNVNESTNNEKVCLTII
ncbi:MAG: hypothetical protein KF870_11240 [Leadbetterella sp.]|nr:hypothetical protein [Leadbetterella sp.]